jgi:glycosyltransferase involved in cell wall biosynthesis
MTPYDGEKVLVDQLVSVIMPVYNGEKYLAEAIQSVLAQTWRSIEVIVVDDGSTDGSADIAQSFGPQVRYCYQPNRGTGTARNKGVKLARGTYLAFLDQDDLWVPHKITLQMAAFFSNTDADIVFGHVEQFYSPEFTEGIKKGIPESFKRMPGYHVGAMLIKRDNFRRIGMFGTNYQIAEFVEWYVRAQGLGVRNCMLPGIVMRRRIHKKNQSYLKLQHRVEYVRILKVFLDRRRLNGFKSQPVG